jgi:hypothetical protein
MGSSEREAWQRRHAVQIAAQLPDNPEDAIRVLEYARELVRDFLSPQRSDEERGQTVIALREHHPHET